ncbi:hypothetical protein HN682_02535 [Candidatus Peregrinibacteria bacterium]|nr:hypothetical protein [Candidatus Peregrinibacteria bacterium]
MTKKEIILAAKAIDPPGWNDNPRCDSFLILPGLGSKSSLHDSGYRCMSVILLASDNAILGEYSGGSDVLHVDGIGGYGKDWLNKYGTVPAAIPPSGWSIDCLARSGLLRVFPSSGQVEFGCALSSLEFYNVPKDKPDE